MVYRVLVADDNEDFRVWLRALLDAEPDFEVVAEAKDGLEAVELADTFNPDIAVLDVVMPGIDGFEAAQRIQARLPAVFVVLATAFEETAYRAMAVRGISLSFTPKKNLTMAVIRQIVDVGLQASTQ